MDGGDGGLGGDTGVGGDDVGVAVVGYSEGNLGFASSSGVGDIENDETILRVDIHGVEGDGAGALSSSEAETDGLLLLLDELGLGKSSDVLQERSLVHLAVREGQGVGGRVQSGLVVIGVDNGEGETLGGGGLSGGPVTLEGVHESEAVVSLVSVELVRGLYDVGGGSRDRSAIKRSGVGLDDEGRGGISGASDDGSALDVVGHGRSSGALRDGSGGEGERSGDTGAGSEHTLVGRAGRQGNGLDVDLDGALIGGELSVGELVLDRAVGIGGSVQRGAEGDCGSEGVGSVLVVDDGSGREGLSSEGAVEDGIGGADNGSDNNLERIRVHIETNSVDRNGGGDTGVVDAQVLVPSADDLGVSGVGRGLAVGLGNDVGISVEGQPGEGSGGGLCGSVGEGRLVDGGDVDSERGERSGLGNEVISVLGGLELLCGVRDLGDGLVDGGDSCSVGVLVWHVEELGAGGTGSIRVVNEGGSCDGGSGDYGSARSAEIGDDIGTSGSLASISVHVELSTEGGVTITVDEVVSGEVETQVVLTVVNGLERDGDGLVLERLDGSG